MVVSSLLAWSEWQPLQGSWLGQRTPSKPGLYRIRRIGRTDLDYIGQTGSGGMTLKKRMGMLRGVYASMMPYRDPHTVGPALWALRHQSVCDFEVSIVPLEATSKWAQSPQRKGLEALAISLYRQQYGRSPNHNFGRMPTGYSISSGNNSNLVARGLLFRGGPTTQHLINHEPGIPPVGPLTADFAAADWCGHQWSDWVPAREAAKFIPRSGKGLYRIRRSEDVRLTYIGEGVIASRITSHLRKANNPNDRQAMMFGDINLLASWVLNNDWLDHQRQELENDLIAAHLLFVGDVPTAQFLAGVVG